MNDGNYGFIPSKFGDGGGLLELQTVLSERCTMTVL